MAGGSLFLFNSPNPLAELAELGELSLQSKI